MPRLVKAAMSLVLLLGTGLLAGCESAQPREDLRAEQLEDFYANDD